MAPKRFNVLNALRFLIKRFDECVMLVIKSALRRFKGLGSLNSAENVGNGGRTFGQIYQRTLSLLARALRLRTRDWVKRSLPKGENIHTTHSFFTTFRVPYAVLRYGGAQFLVFLVG